MNDKRIIIPPDQPYPTQTDWEAGNSASVLPRPEKPRNSGQSTQVTVQQQTGTRALIRVGQWSVVLGTVVLAWTFWRHAPALPITQVWDLKKYSIGLAVLFLVSATMVWRLAGAALRFLIGLAVVLGIVWLFWHFY